jgi:hypothetical protein
MRFSFCVAIGAAAVLGASCARTKTAGAAKPAPIVTPDTTLVGRVIQVNARSRYVIVNFPVGSLPSASQTLGVYRAGLKVGEVRIDERWRRDDNMVADLLAGEAQAGDEVRDR